MKYSQLSIIQKINFKSYCLHYTLRNFGSRTANYHLMSVDGIVADLKLLPYQYTAPYTL